MLASIHVSSSYSATRPWKLGLLRAGGSRQMTEPRCALVFLLSLLLLRRDGALLFFLVTATCDPRPGAAPLHLLCLYSEHCQGKELISASQWYQCRIDRLTFVHVNVCWGCMRVEFWTTHWVAHRPALSLGGSLLCSGDGMASCPFHWQVEAGRGCILCTGWPV